MVAFLLFLVCAVPLSAVAPPACAPEFSFTSIAAEDVQLGQPVTVTWSYSGKPVIGQTLDISDLGYGLAVGADQRSYTFVPAKAGEVHVQVNASSGCDFVKAETQFHVRRCNITPRVLMLQAEHAEPYQWFEAWVDLEKNESVRWVVRGGEMISGQGSNNVFVIAGPEGTLEIEGYISKSANCEFKVSGSVPIVCEYLDVPMELQGSEVVAGETFGASVPYEPGQSLRWEVRGGTISETLFSGVTILADGPGTLEIDAYVTRDGFCETKISRTVPIVCDDSEITMYLNGPEVIAGNTFGAWVDYRNDQTVRWEVRGATVIYTDANSVGIQTTAPGTLEIDAYVTRNGFCERKISSSVPIVCYSDPTRVIYMQPPNGTTPGGSVLANIDALWPTETVRFEVHNGTIESIDGTNVWLTAGAAGTLQLDAYVTHGGCTFKVSKSIPVQ